MESLEYKPILITGCARSGTSITAGIINLSGAWGGRLIGGNPSNEKGMFENGEIRNGIVKPYLIKIGADALGQKPLPKMKVFDTLGLPDVYDWRSKIMNVLFSQGYDGKRQWFYKGAKMCLMWPMWSGAFPKAKWIIVRREDKDLINSCMKTGFMRAYGYEKGWQYWIDQHKIRFQEMVDAGLDVRFVWPQKMISGDFTEIEKVVSDLGLTWKGIKALEFVSPTLWGRN